MNPNQETISTWNKIAHLYEEKFMNLDLYNDSYDRFCALISKKASILEVGCGPGNISNYLLNKQPTFKIEGIDIAPNMIDLAQKNNPTAQFQIMDIRSIRDLNKTYQAIIAGFCIPYLAMKEVQQFMDHCAKLLVNKGILYLSFVEGNYGKSKFQTGSTGDRIFFHYYETDYLLKLLNDQKFHLMERLELPYQKSASEIETHIILIAKKLDF